MSPTPAPLIGDEPDRSHPLMDGLVGWWPMLEGGGGTLYDLSGYGNRGTLTNMDAATDWVVGPCGKALNYDGINDRIDVPAAAAFQNLSQGPMTLSFWLRADSYRVSGQTSYVLNTWSGGGGWSLFFGTAGDQRLSFAVYTTGTTGLWRFATLDTDWHRISLTYDGASPATSPKLFVDGVETLPSLSQNPSGSFVADSGNPLSFMGRDFDNARNQDGALADVRVFRRAIHETEADCLYRDPWAPFARRKVYGIVPAGGGNTTVDATTASLHITPLAATVTPATSIAATTAAVDISPLPASISVGTSVAASVAALSVAPLSASVSAGVLVEASATAVEATPLAATVSAGTAVTASTASMQANGLAASVAAGVSIAATAAQVTIAGNAASVTSGVSVSATVAALHCEALPASVSVGTSISASVAAVEITGNAASVSAVVSVQATTGVVRIASLPVSITFGGRIRRPHLLTGGRMSQDWGLRSGGAL